MRPSAFRPPPSALRPPAPQRVFVSSTSQDLKEHRGAAEEAIRAAGWEPVMMEEFGTSPSSTLAECRKRVEQCDLVLLVLAHRWGSVPSKDQGGDGRRSITAYEVEWARQQGIPVRALFADKSWPGGLWQEGAGRRAIKKFRTDFNQPVVYFPPGPLRPDGAEPEPSEAFRAHVKETLEAHDRWLREQLDEDGVLPPLPAKLEGAESFLPDLEEVLEEVYVPRWELLRLYRQHAPRRWKGVPTDRGALVLLLTAVRTLARALRQSATRQHPLHTFLTDLLPLLPDEQRGRLTPIVQQVRQGLGVPRVRPGRRRAADSAEPAALRRLLVQVTEALSSPGCYHVKAWLFDPPAPTALVMAEEAAYPREGLPDVLDALRGALAGDGHHPDDYCLELLLPRALLCTHVERWAVRLGPMGRYPVGDVQPVVLRSVERARDATSFESLRKRWQGARPFVGQVCRLVAGPDGAAGDPPAALTLADAAAGGLQLYHRLRDRPDVVGAVLAAPPPAEPHAEEDLLNTLLYSGLPLIVWPREPLPEGGPEFRCALEQLLTAVPLRRLPEHVWRYRQNAHGGPGTAACQPALLWEDADCPSPDFDPQNRFRSPRPAAQVHA